MAGNNPKVDLVSNNAYTKFDEILSIASQDIECKRNYDGMTELRTTQIQYSPHFFKSGAINSKIQEIFKALE